MKLTRANKIPFKKLPQAIDAILDNYVLISRQVYNLSISALEQREDKITSQLESELIFKSDYKLTDYKKIKTERRNLYFSQLVPELNETNLSLYRFITYILRNNRFDLVPHKFIPDFKIDVSGVPSTIITNSIADAQKSNVVIIKNRISGKASKSNYRKYNQHKSFKILFDNRRTSNFDFGKRVHIKIGIDLSEFVKWDSCKYKSNSVITGNSVLATIKKDAKNNWFITYFVEAEPSNKYKKTNVSVGFDWALGNDLFFTSTGQKPIDFLAEFKVKLWRIFDQRKNKLARRLAYYISSRDKKKKHGFAYKRWNKKAIKLRKRMINLRNDQFHRLALAIIKQVDFIAIENLDIMNLKQSNLKGHGRSWHNAAIATFIDILKTKAENFNRVFHKIELKRFASTQICSSCGHKNTKIKGFTNLGVKSWVCPNCNATHNRDINAAKNILQQSVIEFNQSLMVQ